MFRKPRHGNTPDVQRQTLGLGRCGTYTQWIKAQPSNQNQRGHSQPQGWLQTVPYEEKSVRKRRPRPQNTPRIGILTNGTNDSLHRKETHGLDKRFEVARLEGAGVGRTGVWGARDLNTCTRSGSTRTSCSRAQGRPSGHLDLQQDGGECEPNGMYTHVQLDPFAAKETRSTISQL